MARLLSDVALDIQRSWPKPSVHAVPYINAMLHLGTLKDKYGCDDARSIVVYFLSNVSGFRGPEAVRLKNELKAMLKAHRKPEEAR